MRNKINSRTSGIAYMFKLNNSITVSKELFLITQEHLCFFLKKNNNNPNNGENCHTQVNDVSRTALGSVHYY